MRLNAQWVATTGCETVLFCAGVATALLRAAVSESSRNPTVNAISTLELSRLKDDLSLMEKLLDTKRN